MITEENKAEITEFLMALPDIFKVKEEYSSGQGFIAALEQLVEVEAIKDEYVKGVEAAITGMKEILVKHEEEFRQIQVKLGVEPEGIKKKVEVVNAKPTGNPMLDWMDKR